MLKIKACKKTKKSKFVSVFFEKYALFGSEIRRMIKKKVTDTIGNKGIHKPLVWSISVLVGEIPGNDLIIGNTSSLLNNKRFNRNNKP
jgi:hypothetical protein